VNDLPPAIIAARAAPSAPRPRAATSRRSPPDEEATGTYARSLERATAVGVRYQEVAIRRRPVSAPALATCRAPQWRDAGPPNDPRPPAKGLGRDAAVDVQVPAGKLQAGVAGVSLRWRDGPDCGRPRAHRIKIVPVGPPAWRPGPGDNTRVHRQQRGPGDAVLQPRPGRAPKREHGRNPPLPSHGPDRVALPRAASGGRQASRAPGSAGTSTAYSLSTARGTISSARSCVEAKTTGAAASS
jgi:hypothetical protein